MHPAIYVDEFLLLPFPENIRIDPAAFLEEPVETIGSIGEVYAPKVFELDGEILVLTPGIDADPITGADVLLRGTVGIVDRELTPRETGLELSPEFLEEWEGHPYVLAEELEIFRLGRHTGVTHAVLWWRRPIRPLCLPVSPHNPHDQSERGALMVTRAELLELLDRLDEEDAEKVLAYLRTLDRPRSVAEEDLTDVLHDAKDIEDVLDDGREADRYGA